MKTVIKLHGGKTVAVYPNGNGGITLNTGPHNEPIQLNPDQAGVLIFGLEKAAEALELAQVRAAAAA